MNTTARWILLLLVLLFSAPGQSAQWQTTEFQVFAGEPNLDINSNGLETRDFSAMVGMGPSQAVIDELEDYLHDVAVALQNDGFADPVAAGTIKPLVELPDGRKAIRVYLFDITADLGVDKLGFRTGPCDTPPHAPKLLLNSRYVYSGDKVTDSGYQNAAHELFHAVQYASNFKRVPAPCAGGSWITEGTADAVGFDYARRLRNIDSGFWNTRSHGPRFFKAWGGRGWYVPLTYRVPLNSDGEKVNSWDYQTSAFWRDLAELNHAKKKNIPHPQSTLAPTDYSYLADLFSTRPPGTGQRHELQWLDTWLRSYGPISRDLAPVYAQFTASAADHMWRRIPDIRGLPSGEREQRWLRYLFQDCAEVTLSASEPAKEHDFELDLASARCVKVKINNAPRSRELVIQDTTSTNAEQKQLRIGAIGGQLVSQGDIREDNNNAGKSYAWWRFPVSPDDENIFVISNMSRTAGSTSPIEPTLHFSLPRWHSTLRDQQAVAATEAASTGQPKTSEAASTRQKSLRTSPTTESATAAMAGRQPDVVDPGCSTARKGRNQCGPQVSVALTLDYGGIPDPALIGGSGGMLSQLGGITGDSNPGSFEDDANFMEAMQLQAQHNKGNTIAISFPLVPYGFTGDFNNAQISVTDTKPGTLDALQSNPTEQGEHPPNGSVNIIEYTPNVLRGTFSAQLVDQKQAIHTTNGTILPVVESVSGTFSVSAPWRGHAAPSVEPDGVMMEGIRADLIDFMQSIPQNMRSSLIGGPQRQSLCQVLTSQDLENLGIPAGCSGGGGLAANQDAQCDCSCETFEIERQSPTCRRQCDPEWIENQCYGSVLNDAGPQDEETIRFESELRALSEASQFQMQENAIVAQVFLFQTSTPDVREMLWQDLEQGKQQLAERQREEAAQAAEPPSAAEAGYDSETLRYKAAVEALGLPPDITDDLVEMFHSNEAAFRETLWERVNNSPLNQQ